MAGDWDNTDTSWKDMGSSQGDAGSSGYRRPFDMPSNSSSSYTNDQTSLDNQQTNQNFDSTYSQIGADVYQPPASSNRASDQTAGQQQPTQEQQQGRATYGGVAPSALNLPPLDAQSPPPYANPNGGRAGYNDVAPPARQLPPMDNTGAGTGAGAGNPYYPGTGEQWMPSPNQLPGGSGDVGVVSANGSDPLPAAGANFADGAQIPTADDRLNATNALNMQLNYPRHYLEGALGGALGANASSIASGLDKVAGNFPNNRVSTSWSNWRANSAAASPAMELPAKTVISPNATAEGAPAPQPNRGTAAWNSFKSPNSLPTMERTLRGAGWGIAGVTAGLVANNYIDKAFGKDHNLSGPQFWEGPAMAAAALIPNSNGKRILGMAGVAVASNVIGDKLPLKNDGTYSTLMQPNWVDSLGLGFAAAMPGGLTKKALTYGAAYAGARGLNALEAMPFVDAPGVHEQGKNQRLNDELTDALGSTKVTADSFNNIVDKTTKLGFENEGAMSVQSADFLNKEHDPLTHMHGAAALYTGIGDVWLERGTKLKTKALDTDSRILAGKDYDLGGQATDFYRRAYTNINESMNQVVAKFKDSENPEDYKDSDQYKELEKSEKVVSERLDKIYGEHEIQPLFDDLKETYRQDLNAMTHYYPALKEQVFGLQTKDTQYAAKMCRDLALVSMAIASYKADQNEGGGAQTLYADAAQALDAAKRIDGEHPDLKQLEQIASKVLPATDKASENQWNSNFNEPFDVNNDGK